MGWGKFSNFINSEVGGGTNFCFCYDWCYGDGILKDTFLDLYRISQNKEAFVANYVL